MTTPDLTIVCCVEHGRLETQTLLMARSLRRFGGKFADVPVIAVVGRSGAQLSDTTIDEFARLKVELVRSPPGDNPFPWFNYANKLVAVQLANACATTATVAWIDSDILFADEPEGLLLSDDEDFAARSDPLLSSVEAGSAKNETYWRRLSELIGVDYDDLIWVENWDALSKILYFNSGVFVWRRGTAFVETYYRSFCNLLRSRLAQADGSFFSADQIILNAVIVRSRVRWRHMRVEDHHMVFPGLLEGAAAAPDMGKSAILHYSGSLSDPYRPVFLRRLANESPLLATWLAEQEAQLPPLNHALHVRLYAKSLKLWRGLRWRAFAKRAIRIHDEIGR